MGELSATKSKLVNLRINRMDDCFVQQTDEGKPTQNKSLQQTIAMLTERINAMDKQQSSIENESETIKYTKNGIIGMCMLVSIISLISVRCKYSSTQSKS